MIIVSLIIVEVRVLWQIDFFCLSKIVCVFFLLFDYFYVCRFSCGGVLELIDFLCMVFIT